LSSDFFEPLKPSKANESGAFRNAKQIPGKVHLATL
jgi:hypothetical protein